MCEGCERCLTPSAWEYFRRVKEAHEAKNQVHRVTRFLGQQALAEEKVKLTSELYTHHCNHPNVIPHYPNWWSGDWNPGNYFCRVCRTSLSPQELLASYERTKEPGMGGHPEEEGHLPRGGHPRTTNPKSKTRIPRGNLRRRRSSASSPTRGQQGEGETK